LGASKPWGAGELAVEFGAGALKDEVGATVALGLVGDGARLVVEREYAQPGRRLTRLALHAADALVDCWRGGVTDEHADGDAEE
jgi:hypothetical protein